MKTFPFTDYDFWGYLSAGFLLLFALDYSFGTAVLVEQELTVVQSIVAASVAYVVGHLIAGLSSAIVERRLSKWFGHPSDLLTSTSKAPRWAYFIYPSYLEPLAQGTLAALNSKKLAGEDARSLFQRAYRITLKSPKSAERLASFLNQYGFCRNVSFAAICSAAALAICSAHTSRENSALWATCAAFVGIGMFFRYLKFYRLFSVEVLTTFAYEKGEAS